MRRIIFILITLIIASLPLEMVQAAENKTPSLAAWEIINKTIAEDIIAEDEEYLFLRVSGEPMKVHKSFTGGLQPLTEVEHLAMGSSLKHDNIEQIQADRIKFRENVLYLDQLPFLDISSYIEEDRRFYESNPQYEYQPMQYMVNQYQPADGSRLIYVVTYLNTCIPAPYTPSYTDLIWIKGGKCTIIPVEQSFRLERVLENKDGSFWLTGSLRNGKIITDKSLYLVKADASVTSLNSMLQKNDLEVLGHSQNSVVVNAQTQAVSPYFVPASNRYNTKNSGIYSISSALKITPRTKNPTGYRQVFLSSNGSIYGIKTDGKEIFNLTQNKSLRLTDDESAYDSYIIRLDQAKETLPVSNPRTDKDGSSWYVKNQRIIHRVGDREWVFNRGLNVLMYPVNNLFIDEKGGKWFLGVAGISYYAPGFLQAGNMNPLIDGGLPVGDYNALYVDAQQKIWHFGEIIRCCPYGGHTSIAPESSLIKGYSPVRHSYLELAEKGIFVYQKEATDQTHSLRILSINRRGIITEQTYISPSPAIEAQIADDILLIRLSDGIMKIENGTITLMSNPFIDESMVFQAIDRNTYAFVGIYRIVILNEDNK